MWARHNFLATALAIAALLCIGSVRGFDFVPITSLYYAGASTGSTAGDSAACLSKGGYLATEATEVLHSADIAAIKNAIGDTTIFYAYLGGGVNLQRGNQGGVPNFCPWSTYDPEYPSYIAIASSGYPDDCVYRWRVGRWEEMTSDAGQEPDEAHAGVAFYKGQNSGIGAIYGFPTWWLRANSLNRPGISRGRYLLLFQNSETMNAGLPPQWTDNYGLNGYTYAEVPYNPEAGRKTLSSFYTVCQNQGPFRLNYEDPRASTSQKSDLQYVWWVIFFVILFVLCLIAFLVIAFCQEREDMDEPPEDAPEWAEQETEERRVSKSYVSQRSFHQSREASDLSSRHSGAGSNTSSTLSKNEHYEEESV